MALGLTSITDRVRQEVERNTMRARNGIRLAVGASRPNLGASPKDVVWTAGRAQLWHYRSDQVRVSPPLLIVFSVVSKSYILDLTPGNSFIEKLIDAGFDVYLLDWGLADERDAGNEFSDYVDGMIPAAIERVRRRSGVEKINLLGYCFGGDLTLLHAAHHPDSPLQSLTVMATPVDFHKMTQLVDPTTPLAALDDVLDDDGNVPASVILAGFRSLTPTAEVTQYVDLWERLWSDEYVAAYQAMTGWAQDHVPFPGALARQSLEMLVHDNGLVTDRLVVGGDEVHLADITVPFLTVRAMRDHIVPEASSAPLIDLVGSPDKHELQLSAGHIGLVVGKTAARTTIPTIIDFLQRRSKVSS